MVNHISYPQQHKVFAAAVILTSSCYNCDQRIVMKVEENALAGSFYANRVKSRDLSDSLIDSGDEAY